MKTKYRSKGLAPIITAVVLVLVFSISIAFAVGSLSGAEGEVKTAREAPDSLVSAGAPRSQLELRRMFESMSLSYTENGKEVYEPVSAEYRRSVGEGSSLAVEEILFVISDTVAAYEKYDIIRFRSASGEIEREITPTDIDQSRSAPFHRAALEQIHAVADLIRLRIECMSEEGRVVDNGDGSYRYAPRRVEREKGSYESHKSFLFDGGRIIFEAENGTDVLLYPTEKDTAACRIKVLLATDTEISESEKATLSAAGYDPARCRNITPEYWYSETGARLFVLGGKVILADGDTVKALLPEDHKLTSAALGNGVLYFTSSFEGGSSAWEYSDGETERLFDSDEKYLAAIEPLEGEYGDALIFAAEQIEDGRFVTALECRGEPIAEYLSE